MTTIFVSSGVTSTSVAVPFGTEMEILSGGTAISCTAIGTIADDLGGVASDTFVSSGALFYVNGDASHTTVGSRGDEIVNNGGYAVDSVIDGGGLEAIYLGAGSGGTVENDGSAYATGDTGMLLKVTVENGGHIAVAQGGTVSGAVLSGVHAYLSVGSGGHASATILKGGFESVTSSGISVKTYARSGANVNVSSGGLTSETRVSGGGHETVSRGGESIGAFVLSGGVEAVSSTGTVSGLTISKGGQFDWARGGVAAAVTLHTFAEIFVDITSATAVFAGGALEVMSSGGGAVLQSATIVGGGAGFTLTVDPISSGLTEIVITKPEGAVVHDGATKANDEPGSGAPAWTPFATPSTAFQQHLQMVGALATFGFDAGFAPNYQSAMLTQSAVFPRITHSG